MDQRAEISQHLLFKDPTINWYLCQLFRVLIPIVHGRPKRGRRGKYPKHESTCITIVVKDTKTQLTTILKELNYFNLLVNWIIWLTETHQNIFSNDLLLNVFLNFTFFIAIVTNYHKLRKPQTTSIYYFTVLYVRSPCWMRWVLVELGSYLGAFEKNPLLNAFGLLTEFSSLRLQDSHPLDNYWPGYSQPWETPLQSLPHGPSVF